ncbi:MAG: efflux RND transporter permease subunit, partial [Chitinivibrionales bacterium]
MINKLIRLCLDNKLITAMLALSVISWGIVVAPFEWDLGNLPRDPVPVDAIPDIGENQQIVFTRWMGRSPQDIEDQVTYPLTVSLLGMPGVKTVRSLSMFGFSSIYVVFKEDVEFYWSRSRIMEKISSLSPGTLPEGVKPRMGPDATALGQVYWYTLEGRDSEDNPAEGWNLEELRTIQDWYVRYGLMSAEGVSEVASVGGHVKEYQIDVDPNAMHSHGISLKQIYNAVKNSNLDVGARTIEINSVEYIIRGVGFVKNPEDLRKTVITSRDNVPITIDQVASVKQGPALRRGVLDKAGAEAVGGVVVTRYGENPLEVIKNIKQKIKEIEPGLPEKTLDDGRSSKVKIIPFYDRSGLIRETLGTLNTAIYLEILITVLVILFMISNISSSLIISSVLPAAVLMSFIGMKVFGVDANIVSLSGIAIAIGTIVDMGIILSENVVKHINMAEPGEKIKEIVYKASSEVGNAMLTAVLTTIVSFLPVFTMEAAEGKLFKPLAFTKTFALIASIIISLTVLPSILHIVFRKKRGTNRLKGAFKWIIPGLLLAAGIFAHIKISWWTGVILDAFAIKYIMEKVLSGRLLKWIPLAFNGIIIGVVGILLTTGWRPLGASKHFMSNLFFVVLCVGGILLLFKYIIRIYPRLMKWFLYHKAALVIPVSLVVLLGMVIWLGFSTVFFFLPKKIHESGPVSAVSKTFPGLGKEFMPPLDEGSYLYMPTTMTHASIGGAHDIMRRQDIAINAIPEVESAVGKLGRAETPLDPAPVSMIETIINTKPEYKIDEKGNRIKYRYNPTNEEYPRDADGELIPDENGRPFRIWRDHIEKPDDIWDEIVQKAKIIGVTDAPKLQPIAARNIMLQSGMRAPMGIKVKGPDLRTIEDFGLKLEKHLKEVPKVKNSAVYADRIVGKPYLEIEIDRDAIARYGLSVKDIQDVIEIAMGGKTVTKTVEGRERYSIRVRYKRELRGMGEGIKDIKKILVTTGEGSRIPLEQVVRIQYRRGPQVIKSEDTFLTGYVLFDKQDNAAEVDVVESAKEYLDSKIRSGELPVPEGASYVFAGNYENQIRSEKRLALILPIALFLIFMILFFQFKKISTTMLVFTGILIAWSGGFILIWLYGQEWFLNFDIFGTDLRELFQIHKINLSVA